MPDDSNKVAAAILACEASRQQQAIINVPGQKPPGRDVAGELWRNYEYFLGKIVERDGKV